MIIRAAIAAPFAMGVFATLVLVPGNAGFGASALCYVLMMVALSGERPGFLKGGDDEGFDEAPSPVPADEDDDEDEEPTNSLFIGLYRKGRRLVRKLPFLRRRKAGEEIEEAKPDLDEVFAELKEELADLDAESSQPAPGDEANKSADEVDIDSVPVDPPEGEVAGPAGRFAFLRALLSKAPGLKFLRSVSVKVEVTRTPEEEPELPSDEAVVSAEGTTVEDEEPAEGYVDIDDVDLGDRPPLVDRVPRLAAPLMAVVALFTRIVAKVARRERPVDEVAEADEASEVAVEATPEPRPEAVVPLEPRRPLWLRLCIASARAVGLALLVLVLSPMLLTDLLLTAVRNRMAGRQAGKREAQASVEAAYASNAAPEITPASLYGEYEDAA